MEIKRCDHVSESGSDRKGRRIRCERGVTNLCALGDGVLGKLTGEDEADGSLDLTGRDGRLLVVCGQLGSLGSDTLEDIWEQSDGSGDGN